MTGLHLRAIGLDQDESQFGVFSGDSLVGMAIGSVTRSATPALAAMHPDERNRRNAVAAATIGHVERHVATGAGYQEVVESGLELQITSYNIDDILNEVGGPKVCDRQVAVGGDLWCSAWSATDEMARRMANGAMLAPTSEPLCLECDVPDSRLRCSHFAHPEVTGIRAGGGTLRRQCSGAICNRGHQSTILRAPEGCVPGEHDCWERVVTSAQDLPPDHLDPLALPDALDRFDDAWKAAMGSRLLHVPTATDAAIQAFEATDRSEFVDCLRGLSEILDAMEVSDGLIPGGTAVEHATGSLNRIESAMRGVVTEDDVAGVQEAIEQLRRVRRLDNAFSHKTGELPVVAPPLGIEYPIRDWPRAWRAVRSVVIDALRTLGRILRRTESD